MTKHIGNIIIVVVILFAAVAGAIIWFGSRSSRVPVIGQVAGASIPTPNDSRYQVLMSNFSYIASSITINRGESITWTNNDNSAHTVTANDGSFDSGPIEKDGAFTYRFTTPGTYRYHCTYHSMMKGTVIVK